MAKPLFHHRRKPPNATAAGSNALSFSGKDAYDDVFSGGLKPKFGAAASAPASVSSRRVAAEDFAEIFGGKNGTRGSSIPVLDLSDLDDRSGSGDFRSSGGGKVDYSMIFGGGDDVPASVPAYEELFTGVKKAKRNEAKARYFFFFFKFSVFLFLVGFPLMLRC